MFDNVTVEDKFPENLGIAKRDDELGFARFSIARRWNAESVSKTVEMGRFPVDFGDKKSGLLDMKIVVLRILVEDGPFLGVTELHGHIGTIFLKDFVIDEEFGLFWVHRERERPPMRDWTGANNINVQRRVGM